MKELVTRALSGVLFVALFISSALFWKFGFICFLVIVCFGSLEEFYRLAGHGAEPQTELGALFGSLTLWVGLSSFAGSGGPDKYAVIVGLLSVVYVFISELYRKRENPIVNVAVTLAGWLYIALPLYLIVMMAQRNGEYRPWIVLWFAFMVWTNDVVAYIVGVMIGKHRLMERISPKKSWEGFFGGFAATVGIGFLAASIHGYDSRVLGLMGVVVCISGVLGDLVESMFKRSVGVKDSGTIMPGHGGFLDRFDAMLMAAPFAYIITITFNL